MARLLGRCLFCKPQLMIRNYRRCWLAFLLNNDSDRNHTDTLREEIKKFSGIKNLKHEPQVMCGPIDEDAEIYFNKTRLIPSEQVFTTMVAIPRHTYQVLTKRAQRVEHLSGSLPWPNNIWLGVSVESDAYQCRIDRLRRTPAARQVCESGASTWSA